MSVGIEVTFRPELQQRKTLPEGSDDNGAKDAEPDFATHADSVDDSKSKDNDETFAMRKSKEIIRKK